MCLSLYILIRWCIHVACIVLVLIVPVFNLQDGTLTPAVISISSVTSLNCDGPRRTQTASIFLQISGKTSDFSSITETIGLLAHFVPEAFLNESVPMLSRNPSIEDTMKQRSPLKFAVIKESRLTLFSFQAVFKSEETFFTVSVAHSPPTHIVCSTENNFLLGRLQVILGNIQYSRKCLTEAEVDEAGWGKESSSKRWIAALQHKEASQARWHLTLSQNPGLGFSFTAQNH